MGTFNSATIIGHVGADPECRSTADTGRVATFSVATSEKWNDDKGNPRERTEWHRVVAWDRGNRTLAALVERYIHKGDSVHVEGKIRYREWTDKDGGRHFATEIDAQQITLLTSKREGPADVRA